LLQLHQQAFLQVAGADAGGFELLQAVQHGHHLIQFDVGIHVLQQAQANIVQVLSDSAVVIGCVNNGQGNEAVHVRKPGQVQLPQQLFTQ